MILNIIVIILAIALVIIFSLKFKLAIKRKEKLIALLLAYLIIMGIVITIHCITNVAKDCSKDYDEKYTFTENISEVFLRYSADDTKIVFKTTFDNEYELYFKSDFLSHYDIDLIVNEDVDQSYVVYDVNHQTIVKVALNKEHYNIYNVLLNMNNKED